MVLLWYFPPQKPNQNVYKIANKVSLHGPVHVSICLCNDYHGCTVIVLSLIFVPFVCCFLCSNPLYEVTNL